MAQLIDKAAVVAEINKRIKEIYDIELIDQFWTGQITALKRILNILDTLEVKEVVEYDDSDLNMVLSEFGVEPDSSFANSLKDAFYKCIEND